MVNDGSTDRSGEIILDYAQRYPHKIKAFLKENGGLSDARNFGIDIATGDFIGFVDSDDYVSASMFQEMAALAEEHNAEMVICNVLKVDELGKIKQKITQVPNMPDKIDLESNFSVFSDISYFACNKLFKRSLFNEKRFKKNVHFEDLLKWATLNGAEFLGIDDQYGSFEVGKMPGINLIGLNPHFALIDQKVQRII